MFATLKKNNASATCEIVDALINNKVLARNTFDECFSHNKKK